MKWTALGAALIISAVLLPTGSAQAKGCLKGAVVGGVAGRYLANHGWLGAAAGCLIGQHEANRPARAHYRTSRQYYAGYH
jgi:hypothetical protein